MSRMSRYLDDADLQQIADQRYDAILERIDFLLTSIGLSEDDLTTIGHENLAEFAAAQIDREDAKAAHYAATDCEEPA